MLWVCGYREETLALLSDKVCTALQLPTSADVVEDAERGRRYLPAESLLRYNVDEGQIEGRVFTPEFRAMMQDLVGVLARCWSKAVRSAKGSTRS